MDEREAEPVTLQTLRAHDSDVSACDLTRTAGPTGGLILATGGADGGVRLWRWVAALGFVPTAGERRAHRYGVTALAFSDAGAMLASAGADGATRVWTATDLRALRALPAGGGAAPRALCWAGTALLVTAHDDGALVAWDVRRGEESARADGEADGGAAYVGVASVCAGAAVAGADADGTVRLYSLPDLRALCREGGAHDAGCTCAAGRDARLATGGHDGLVRLWEVRGGRGARLAGGAVLAGHASAVTGVRWAADGDTLGSASMDRTARLWSASRGECLRVLDAHRRYVGALAFSPDDALLVTGSNDRTARVWSLRGAEPDAVYKDACSSHRHFGIGDLQGIEEVPESPEPAAGAMPAHGVGSAGGPGGARDLWAGRGEHAGAINAVAMFGRQLATASSDRAVRVFERAAEDVGLELRYTLAGHRYPAMAVDFCSDGRWLLSAGLDGLVIVWDVQEGSRVRTLSAEMVCAGAAGGGGVRGVRWARGGAGGGAGWVAAASDDNALAVWELSDAGPAPRFVCREHDDAVTCCAWADTDAGRVLLAGGAGGELVLYCGHTARALCRRDNAHDLGVQSCDAATDVGPDGSLLVATCGCDSAARLWTLRRDGTSATLRERRVLRGHGGTVTCCRLDAEGAALLATTATDMHARVWRVGSGACVACVRLAGAGGAVCLRGGRLAAGALTGDLALWEVGAGPGAKAGAGEVAHEDEEAGRPEGAGAAGRWRAARVALWLREHLPPAGAVGQERLAAAEERLVARIEEGGVDGETLLETPLRDLAERFGFEEIEDTEDVAVELEEENWSECAWLVREVWWVRAAPRLWALADRHPERFPHACRCPASHRALLEPVSCADGYTYDRAALQEHLLCNEMADGAATSPTTGRPLHNTRTVTNRRARDNARRALLDLRRATTQHVSIQQK